MSPVSRSRGPGGDVAGAGLGRVSRVRTGTWRCPSAGGSTWPSPWTGLERAGVRRGEPQLRRAAFGRRPRAERPAAAAA